MDGGCGIHVFNDERSAVLVFIYNAASQSGRLVLLATGRPIGAND